MPSIHPSSHPPYNTQLEFQQLALLRLSSHHLPSQPPKLHSDCLAFRQICHRLSSWDTLHAYRTGDEQMFQNYHDECPVGPEILWAIYPRRLVYRAPARPLVQYDFPKLDDHHFASTKPDLHLSPQRDSSSTTTSTRSSSSISPSQVQVQHNSPPPLIFSPIPNDLDCLPSNLGSCRKAEVVAEVPGIDGLEFKRRKLLSA